MWSLVFVIANAAITLRLKSLRMITQQPQSGILLRGFAHSFKFSKVSFTSSSSLTRNLRFQGLLLWSSPELEKKHEGDGTCKWWFKCRGDLNPDQLPSNKGAAYFKLATWWRTASLATYSAICLRERVFVTQPRLNRIAIAIFTLIAEY